MRPDLEAIRARNLVDWTGNGKEELSGDVAALLAYVEELERELCCETGAHEWRRSMKYDIKCAPARYDLRAIFPEALDKDGLVAYVRELQGKLSQADERVLSADKRLEQCARERDEARDQSATFLDLYKKQCADDAKQMREYGLTYDGIRNLVAEYEREELSIGKIVELLRAAARELAKGEVEVLQTRLAELERVRP